MYGSSDAVCQAPISFCKPHKVIHTLIKSQVIIGGWNVDYYNDECLWEDFTDFNLIILRMDSNHGK